MMLEPNPRFRIEEAIRYEDESLLAIDKPAGWPSLDLRNQLGTGLLHLMRRYEPNAKLCHRLDQMTTGVLLFARNAEAYRNLALQFENRTVRKQYDALVVGSHVLENRWIELPLSSTAKGRVVVDPFQGKPSVTQVSTRQAFGHFSWLVAQPLTGRSHQIRVHLASIGCPIVGDELYGGRPLLLSEIKRGYRRPIGEEELPLNRGYLLHARSLEIDHPATGERMEFEASLPKNFQVCLRQLEKYDAR